MTLNQSYSGPCYTYAQTLLQITSWISDKIFYKVSDKQTYLPRNNDGFFLHWFD